MSSLHPWMYRFSFPGFAEVEWAWPSWVFTTTAQAAFPKLLAYAIGLPTAAPDATGAMVAIDGPLTVTELAGSPFEGLLQDVARDPIPVLRTWRAQP